MINELVNSILEAEEKADKIVSEAAEKSAEISAVAEREAAVILKDAENSFRIEAARLTEKNDAEAERLYAEALAAGKASANEIRENGMKKVGRLSEEIAGYILSGNC